MSDARCICQPLCLTELHGLFLCSTATDSGHIAFQSDLVSMELCWSSGIGATAHPVTVENFFGLENFAWKSIDKSSFYPQIQEA